MNFFLSVNRNYAGWKAFIAYCCGFAYQSLFSAMSCSQKKEYTLFNLFIVDIAAIFHSCCDTKKSGFLNANRSNFLCLLMLLHAFRVSRIFFFRLPYEATKFQVYLAVRRFSFNISLYRVSNGWLIFSISEMPAYHDHLFKYINELP